MYKRQLALVEWWADESGQDITDDAALLRELLAEPDGEHVTIQEVWEAAGGNPGIKPAKSDLLSTLRMLDAAVDEAAEIRRTFSAEPQGEPVACQYAQDVCMPEYRCVGKCQYEDPQPQQRKPLTVEQVFASDAIMGVNGVIGAQMLDLMQLIRVVERAHGITGEPT